MYVASTEILGHLLEARFESWWRKSLRVDGREVAAKRGIGETSLTIDLSDHDDKPHLVEVVFTAGMFSYKVRILIDGACVEELTMTSKPPVVGVCRHCGYALKGLRPENDEIQCPECGRHSAAPKT